MISFNKIILLAGSLSLLNNCALLPENKIPAKLLDMPSLSESLKSDAQAEKIVREWPKAQWWQDFHNAELNRLIETALKDSPSLRAAAARLTQAEAVADYQAADMLPSINAGIEFHQRRFSETDFYGPNGGKTFTGAYIDPAVFRYHLDLWGKDKAALESALGKEKAQASELAMARLMLSTAIARSYIRLCSSEEDIELAHGLTEQAEKKMQLAELRWQRGLISQDWVYVGKQQLEAARQRETRMHNQAQLLRNRLAVLVGQGPDWGKTIHIAENKVAGHLPQPESIALGLLAHRPDVAAALWRVEASAQLIKVAKANFYPDVNLVGFAGLRSLNLKDLFLSNGASAAYGMGPTITLPIFEGGRLEAELKNQQAAYDAAVESYNETLLVAVQQVADSLAEWRQTLEHDAAQERALEAANAEATLAEKRYQAGLSSRDGIIDAEAALIQQRLTASELRTAHLLAAVGLIEALGGGYENTT
ncbi:MAG: efflux transporter outer membrane subunit [Methylobacter sp.]|nr:efflux transporter outer membrane subunit [Methylobacter sp.]MDP2427581.1 efflux transporter outer membrane subunit [Methylobacter sp.]MDP3055284.1 efflux transporter outer membrane subunit [Methylobacter sp.]MDP3364046.1 efflux transporter outer membrane subunit [Methylobacter sp.]MDZ4217775.1 efflux transporter outer membrane subunit [Methylobacter sp.]